MQYQEFLAHIYSRYSGNVKLELNRMENLLREMGNPQNTLRGFHVAGTNGKGSVCATLEALCLAHGLSAGLNTSPHLIDYTERFRVRGQEPPFNRILELFQRFEELFEKWDASFFEITTAIAFQLFREEGVHSAVIEVGLGGRLDATNLFKPDISAITSIGLDHVKTLGGTVELIAAEKAGIIKPFVPLIMGGIQGGPAELICAKAREMQAPLYRMGKDFTAENLHESLDGLVFDYRFGGWKLDQLRANLLGEHQAGNLSIALTAFIIYAGKRGIEVSEDSLWNALASVNWRGRMQVLSADPPVILDGAHNVQGVQALLLTLDKLWPGKKVKFLLSILADKDYSEMIRLVCGKAERIYLAQNGSERAATLEEQASEVEKHGVPHSGAESVEQAYRLALRELSRGEALVCGGSLFTVGEVLAACREDEANSF